MIRIPAYPARRYRWALLAGGALVFLWLRIEDSSALLAALSGALLTGLLLVRWWWRRLAGARLALGRWLALGAGGGAALGLGAVVSAAILMLVKNGLHAHLFPDFPFAMIADVLALAPLWAAGGGLLGLGLAALAAAVRG